MSTLSTHILDTSTGKPAAGVPVELRRGGEVLGGGTTDADGRAKDLQPKATKLDAGVYSLRFDVAAYFAATGRASFYPEVVVTFELRGEEHYHVPLLLSPFGYSTYRGS